MGCLYFLTSTYGEYPKDVLNLLALPNGLRYRFRYDLGHLSPELQEEQDLSRLEGTKGLVGLRAPGQAGAYGIAAPLRKVIVREAALFQDAFVHFDFELLDFPLLSENTLVAFARVVAGMLSADVFVAQLDVEFEAEAGESQFDNWHVLVTWLETLERFKSSLFIKLYTVYDEDKNRHASLSNNAYQLKAGRSYRLEFIHLYPKPLFEQLQRDSNEVLGKLFLSPQAMAPILVEQPIRGRYDLNRYYFYCFGSMRTASSALVLTGGSDAAVSSPTVKVPVEIKRSLTRESMFLLLLGAGLFLGGAVDIVLSGMAQVVTPGVALSLSIIPEILARGWTSAGVLAPILAILGLVLAFIMAFPEN